MKASFSTATFLHGGRIHASLMIGVALPLMLTACGGDDSSGNTPPTTVIPPTPTPTPAPTPTPTPTPSPAPSPIAGATSYDIMKNSGVPQIQQPAGTYFTAYAAADFTGSGRIDLIIFRQIYNPGYPDYATIQAAEAAGDKQYLADADYYTGNGGGSFSKSSKTYKTCLHPRKAAVQDFDKDGDLDIFLACHGYDADPFPGEHAILMTNDGAGNFTVSIATQEKGFYHSAAAADLNGDGYMDIVTTDNFAGPSVFALINQKDGKFKRDTSWVSGVPSYPTNYFTAEIFDADNDGYNDLLIGGHENDGALTKILYGAAEGGFGKSGRETVIPAIAGRGVVLDFTLQRDAAKTGLYIGRTADGSSAAGFYNAVTLQWYNLTTSTSETLLDEAGSSNWIPWWLPATKDGKLGVQPFLNVNNMGEPVSYFFSR